jgi:hypothetical protein
LAPTIFAKARRRFADLLCNDNALLPEKTADFIDESDAIRDQTAANPMNRLHRQLFGGLDRHKAHVGSAYRLADGFRVIPIVLVELHVRRDELWTDQSGIVTQIRKRLRPKVCAVRSLHANKARGQVREERGYGMTGKRLAHHRLAMRVDAVNLDDIFRQIQADANDLHDISPSMQLTDDGNPRREGGVHTIGAPCQGILKRCDRFGCGHVFGLLTRERSLRWP